MSAPYAPSVEPHPAPAGLIIRPFTHSDADYTAAVAITNQLFPEYPDTVDEWRFADENRSPHIKQERWLADLDGTPVAYSTYFHFEWMYHPQKFGILICVLPAYQGRGIGATLYNAILAELEPFNPIALRARVREDMQRGIKFILDRSYQEDMREWESRLAVATFDPAPYLGHEQTLRAEGIRIVTVADLLEHDPDCREKIWQLDVELTRDVPSPEPHTPMPRESFESFIFNHPNLLPEAFFVALDGADYVGSTILWKSQADPSELYTGLTGVRRPYRRRGIALALKLRAIAYAQAHGVRTLKTWNEANNRPMLSINEALGFVKQPAWVSFSRRLREG